MTPTFAVTVSPAPLVSVADVRAFAPLPPSVQDGQVQAFIDAALGYLDGPGGWLNRSLGLQTITATLGGPVSGPVELEGGPVLSVVGIAGLPGGDSFGSSRYTLAGDLVTLRGACGPTFGGPAPHPIVITYTAGSTLGVQALVRPVVMTMVAKQVAAAPSAGRDPSLRSESIPDTFSRSYGAGGGPGGVNPAGPFGADTLAPIAHLRRW